MPFYKGEDSHHNVVISFTPNPKYDFGVFARGYHIAANQLAENFLSKTNYGDYEGYPIIFLYRHALELNLKNIIYWAVRLCHFKNVSVIDSQLHNKHELTKLAEIAAPLLLKLFPLNSQEFIELTSYLTVIAQEFDEIDPISFSYRYPIDTKGNYSTKRHQVVDILSIHKNMDELLNKLETINFGLDIETYQVQQISELLNDFVIN
jgi:hypothetical protein